MSSDQQYPYGHGYEDPDAARTPDVAQTWEGQTWDTQYQPAVQPAPQPYPQPAQPYAADTAYLPVQGAGASEGPGPGSYPLPPEVPYEARAPYDPSAPYGASAPHDPYGASASHDPYGAQAPYGDQAPYDPPTTLLRPVTDGAAPAPARAAGPADGLTAASAAAPAGPGYGTATTSGHVRLTDAQRARAEGRSPIIDPGMQPAVLTAALGGLLAAGAALGTYGPLVPLVLLQALTAAGWFRLNGMWPARQGIALAFAGGLTADVALLAVGEEHAPAALLGTLGVWVLLVIVLQLRSHAGSDERQYGLMATVASSALAVVAAGFLAAASVASDAVVVGGLAVAVAIPARALPLPGPATLVVALLAAAGAGAAAGGLTGMGAQGALLGLGAGVCALAGHRVAAYDYPSRFVHMTAGVALPLALAAPAVYVLGRALA
ncbi:hypothetical protein [Streptomyces lavendofoliae]|uniref:Uncharacterized protein n=1 Tax=Streptomyces lavendofoliae TaxID=67314 RepID=A0A918M3J0_9ACTN|nr:hypothetical protein [Streptomyces lavendofoliae]GGU31202.1 hypothetical protein GCM10010274_17500 [Streptomyces lavendofoliae]